MKLIYLIACIFLNSYVFGSEKDDSFFYISSDKLVISENPLISKFIGNAYVRNGINDYWGDNIYIDYDDDKKIKEITIIGNVKIMRLDELVTGDKAIYNVKLEIINISGNVLVKKDSNTLNGDELFIDLTLSTSTMKSHKNNQVSAKVIK